MKPIVTAAGFTIIELTIIIAVIGLLTTISMPYIMRIVDDAYREVVVNKVNEVTMLEYSYKHRTGTYGTATQLKSVYPELDFGINGTTKTYRDVLLGNTGFCAKSVYNKTSNTNAWSILCYFCSGEYTFANAADFQLFTKGMFGENPALGKTVCDS